MGRKGDEQLDESSRKRLKELEGLWTQAGLIREKVNLITPNDLRLLLEHFDPLRELIRTICAIPAAMAPRALEQVGAGPQLQEKGSELTKVCAQLVEALGRCEAAGKDLQQCTAHSQDLQRQREQLQQQNEQLEQQKEQLEQQKEQLQREKEQFQKENAQLLRDKKQLDERLRGMEKELSSCRAQLEGSGRLPPELALLRADLELAQRLELQDLPDDGSRALIQMVAVPAQRDNLLRLWTILRERCDAQNRAANTAERALLETALAWHNHNWRSRPLRLIDVAAATPYDYERHLRSRQTHAGEMVGELRLPGIADGSGALLCKALVSTR